MSDISNMSSPVQSQAMKAASGDIRPKVIDVQTIKDPEIPEMPVITLNDAIARIKEAIEVLNETLATKDRSIRFQLDETIDRAIITVVDKKTGDIVRQLPSEEMLRVAHNIENLKGILIKEWV